MSIIFNGNQVSGFTPISEDETQKRIAESFAKGEAPRPLSFDEFFHMTTDEHNELAGCLVEINRAYSLEEMTVEGKGKQLESITNLNLVNKPFTYDKLYGKMWRVWVGGFPSQELMDATPWEE